MRRFTLSACLYVVITGPLSTFIPDEVMIGHGDSGGPTFDSNGRIAGVHSFMLAPYDGIYNANWGDVGVVDGTDLIAAQTNFANTLMPAGGSSPGVPEPATGVLLLGLIGLLRRQNRGIG